MQKQSVKPVMSVQTPMKRTMTTNELAQMMINHPDVDPVLKGILEYNPRFLEPDPVDPHGLRFIGNNGLDMRGPFSLRRRRQGEGFTEEQKLILMADAWRLFEP